MRRAQDLARFVATSQEGPWYKAHHYEVKLTTASSDASPNQYGDVVSLPPGQFSVGSGFPHDWLPRAINGKEMFALLEVLEQCCRVHPGSSAELR